MASVASALLSGGVGGIADGIAKVINSVKGRNPEDAEKLQELVSKHQDVVIQADKELAIQRSEENIKLNEIAGLNVRADAQSGDKVTARARPSVIYAGIVILLANYALIPFLQKWGFKPVEFPAMFWETWGVLCTGVVFTRTVDKIAQATLGGAGGSIKGFGLNAESKGD